jgi:flagellar motor protein MotB
MEKLKAISFGETKPLEQNDSAKGRAKNRRIEIEIKY